MNVNWTPRKDHKDRKQLIKIENVKMAKMPNGNMMNLLQVLTKEQMEDNGI